MTDKSEPQQGVHLTPAAIAAIVAVLGAPGVANLVQTNTANSALSSIEKNLLSDVEARTYLEKEAEDKAKQEERLENLALRVAGLESRIEAASKLIEDRITSEKDSVEQRMDRLTHRLSELATIVANKLLTPPPAPQAIPQTMPHLGRGTGRLIGIVLRSLLGGKK